MTDSHLSLIRFVTRRQTDLQGLRGTAFALSVLAMLALVGWLAGRLQDAHRMFGPATVIAAWAIASTATACLADRWYRTHYGRVNPSTLNAGRSTRAQSLMGLGAALDLTPWFPYAGISAFVIVAAIHGVWIASRDFPWRGYHLLSVALIGLAPTVVPAARLSGYFPAYASVLACLAVLGVLDHCLLRASLARLKTSARAETSA